MIGGGQAGLAAGLFRAWRQRRASSSSSKSRPGGAWRHGWSSLRLFSPARYSPLPGWWMPDQPGEPFPTGGHVRDYLTAYEARYDLPVRPTSTSTPSTPGPTTLRADPAAGSGEPAAEISATGTWRRPHWPRYPGAHTSAAPRSTPCPTAGPTRSADSASWWSARQFRGPDPRRSLDGRHHHLGHLQTAAVPARRRRRARPVRRRHPTHAGPARRRHRTGGVAGLGDIVMVPPVLAARDRAVLNAEPMFHHLTPDGITWTAAGCGRRSR